MPKIDTKTVTALIWRSQLLDSSRKDALLAVLPRLGSQQLRQLGVLLRKESVLMEEVASRVVQTAVHQENISVLEDLHNFFITATRTVRTAEEEAVVTSEQQRIDSIFDNQS